MESSMFIYIYAIAFILMTAHTADGLNITMQTIETNKETVVTCSLDESDVKQVLVMQVMVYNKTANIWVTLAQHEEDGNRRTVTFGDKASGITIWSSIDSSKPQDSVIIVTFKEAGKKCFVGTEYQCIMFYKSVNPNTDTQKVNGSFDVRDEVCRAEDIGRYSALNDSNGQYESILIIVCIVLGVAISGLLIYSVYVSFILRRSKYAAYRNSNEKLQSGESYLKPVYVTGRAHQDTARNSLESSLDTGTRDSYSVASGGDGYDRLDEMAMGNYKEYDFSQGK